MKYIKVAVPDDYDASGNLRLVDYQKDGSQGSVSAKLWQPEYTNVLNHGFVGLVDCMGDDAAVVNAARVSYGVGTAKSRSDRGLIRYLMRHLHTTPFEMVEFKFHVKAPIFVFRQWHRHRTFSINEYSARYSEMKDEMYEPTIENLAPQSSTNKQGREVTTLSDNDYSEIMSVVTECFETAFQGYKHLLGPNDLGTVPPSTDGVLRRQQWCQEAAVAAVNESRKRAIESDHPNPYPTEESLSAAIQEYLDHNGVSYISDEFPGVARELARMVLPVATYSEMYWKGNMHNLFHFLNLRCDSHAQYEIRVYAEAILELIRPHAEWSVEAFGDYLQNATRLSRMETEVIRELLEPRFATAKGADSPRSPIIGDLLEKKGCNEREITEFLARFA